jgi:NADH-quinone oxidoreductase subunit N
MTWIDLTALAPLAVLAAASVAVMLLAAFRRNHATVAGATVLSLAAALATLPFAAADAPRSVTGLLAVDSFSLFFTALACGAALCVALLAYEYFARSPGPREELYVLILTATLGATALVASRHLAMLFVALELLSVSLFALIAYPIRRRPVEAAIKYLVLSGVSSALLAFGLALVYFAAGALDFAGIGAFVATHRAGPILTTGFVLILAGLGFKLSLVPFHLWTPDVYEGAPAPVTAFIASVSKGAVAALALRYLMESGAARDASLMLALEVVAVATILAGNLLALLQDNIKRILAYSSIAHIGYLLVAFLAAGPLGAEAAAYYLAAYFVMTLGAFGVVSRLSSPQAGREAAALADYRGLFWSRPWLAGTLGAMLLALAGMPLTVGFLAKFYLFAAGVDAALWTLLAALVAGSVIGLFYYLRVAATLVAQPDATVAPRSPSRGIEALAGDAVLCVLAALLVGFGIVPQPGVGLAATAASSLRESAPPRSARVPAGAGWARQLRAARDGCAGISSYTDRAHRTLRRTDCMYSTSKTEAPHEATFELAPLPFADDALEPIISRKTLQLHHGKHHRKYVDTLNDLTHGTEYETLPIEEVIKRTVKGTANQAIFDNAGQAWNHHFYWRSLAPGRARPSGKLLEGLDRDLGGYESFVKAMTKAATGQFGSGWAWLVLDGGKLKVQSTANADTPIAQDKTPLLTLDVWEHAYYLDYQNRREQYVQHVIDGLLNWEFAAKNLG